MSDVLTRPMRFGSSSGQPVTRRDGIAKVTGVATFAADNSPDRLLHAVLVPATIARGRVTHLDVESAEGHPGVTLVLTPQNRPPLQGDPAEKPTMFSFRIEVLQDNTVRYSGQPIALVVGETLEAATEGAHLLSPRYDAKPPRTTLDDNEPFGFEPSGFGLPAGAEHGNIEAGHNAADKSVDVTYETASQYHNAMETHAVVATWDGDHLTLFEASQAVWSARRELAQMFGIGDDDVTVVSPHVGGGFGTKGTLHGGSVLAVVAARAVPGRSVKLALTRREMTDLTGHRPATVQRVRLGAGTDGRLHSLAHDVVESGARMAEFGEPTAVISRHLYASPHRRTSHRVVPLDLSTPTYMRAPGEAPGSFGAESALDELAVALGIDPVELRIRNEPDVDPDTGRQFSSRNLVACLRRGAERFGWADRDPRPRTRLVDGWWHGTGVAAAFFPTFAMPGSAAAIRYADGGAGAPGRYRVDIAAADIGQGARTVLTQIAAEAQRNQQEMSMLKSGTVCFA